MDKKTISLKIAKQGWAILTQKEKDYYNSSDTTKGISEIIYEEAITCIGKKMSGNNKELGCAISVNNICERAIGRPIGGGYSTWWLYEELKTNKTRFKEVKEPMRGDIIISPTGYNKFKKPKITNGHTGIIGDLNLKNEVEIMSNDSKTGIWKQNYTLKTWKDRWEKGGYPVDFFRVLS